MRKQGLLALLEELHRELKRRLPPEPEPKPENGELESEEVFDAEALLPPTVISTQEELDFWLASLREKLLLALEAGKKIRIKR